MKKFQLPKYDCKKVTDPCKICLQTVSPHTGLQCQGACESWVHYECLNYTPGKIKDIEEGIITVTCPCPDCKTTVPKEFLTEENYTCNNVQCPANNPPSCDSPYCQANEMTRQMPARCPPPGTLRSCGLVTCREYSGPTAYRASKADACMEGNTLRTCAPPLSLAEHLSPPVEQIPPPPPPTYGPVTAANHAAACPPAEVMQQMCKTVGDLAEQLNLLMENIKSLERGK
ncbi:uncharacterized protein LOC126377208 [Pectinophora gossypiella]|uniref:uncharacterized protein LOC126377208 n=1 Tax=Pectinophora gossypiella TaxID=13191 RepID=UPI00214EAA98|nr:uncharacterized protein LOC126377208 [Pectinophora gossypiella]